MLGIIVKSVYKKNILYINTFFSTLFSTSLTLIQNDICFTITNAIIELKYIKIRNKMKSFTC